MNFNWTVISVEKGSPNTLSSVLNTSQRVSNKMELFFNFYTLLFFLGQVLINKNFI